MNSNSTSFGQSQEPSFFSTLLNSKLATGLMVLGGIWLGHTVAQDPTRSAPAAAQAPSQTLTRAVEAHHAAQTTLEGASASVLPGSGSRRAPAAIGARSGVNPEELTEAQKHHRPGAEAGEGYAAAATDWNQATRAEQIVTGAVQSGSWTAEDAAEFAQLAQKVPPEVHAKQAQRLSIEINQGRVRPSVFPPL